MRVATRPALRSAGSWPLVCSWRAYASLSAIHKGIRQSQKTRPQGFRAPSSVPQGPDSASSPWGKPLTYKQRQEARAAMAKPTFRIRKGKKDITQRPGDARPKSRAARFNSPDTTFGKRSLVYQLKSGQLREELRKMRDLQHENEDDRGRTMDSAFDHRLPREERRGRSLDSLSNRRPPREERRGRSLDSLSNRRPPREERRGRSAGSLSSRRSPPEERRGRSLDSSSSRRPQRDREWEETRTPRGSYGRSRAGNPREREDRPLPPWAAKGHPRDSASHLRELGAESELTGAERRLRHKREVVSLPYTTAASQFLYGTSVVKAALIEKQRKLYKLYIYGGSQRQNIDQDAAIQILAEKKGVKTQMIYDERVMDKMSGGRPHNGYLLEASPLPQLPVTSLGAFSTEKKDPGYGLNLGWQSAEDAEINGTTDFVPTPSQKHRPLIVVLDQVQDPGNLGAILRTVSFLGATAVAVTKRCSASLTPVALKASAGASEALTLYSVDSISRFLDESRENGWKVFAAAPADYRSKQHRHLDLHQLQDMDPLARDPCILLIGSEGDGLARGLKTRADYEVNIPNFSGSTLVDSLNVSVATGILCSAFFHGEAKSKATVVDDSKLF